MYIETFKIKPEGLCVDDNIQLDENLLVEEEASFMEDLKYNIHFSRQAEKIRAKGGIKTLLSLRCIRCLENFELKVNSKFDIILFPIDQLNSHSTALSTDDMEYIFYEGDRIDLRKILIEQVNLYIPFTPVCSSICKGICSHCGVNLNHGRCQCDPLLNDIHINLKK